jgi:hypothetical protein
LPAERPGRVYEKTGSVVLGTTVLGKVGGHSWKLVKAPLRRVRRPRGRPAKTDEHRQWAEVFRRLDDELNDGDRYDEKLNNIELSALVVDELGLTVTARAVWDAVKPFI